MKGAEKYEIGGGYELSVVFVCLFVRFAVIRRKKDKMKERDRTKRGPLFGETVKSKDLVALTDRGDGRFLLFSFSFL